MGYLPSSSLKILEQRAKVRSTIRRFFETRDYIEVETPILSRDIVVDAHLDPFAVSCGSEVRYLQTSPEFAMKRILAAAALAEPVAPYFGTALQRIYQFAHAFREGERGQRHNPEFSMLEWYQVGDSLEGQFSLIEELIREACNCLDRASLLPPGPFDRVSHAEAFRRTTGLEILESSSEELIQYCQEHGIQIPEGLDLEGLRNLILSEKVEPHLGVERPCFLWGYPPSQSALARIDPGPPRVALRFELYIQGVEICNGYDELTDPQELRKRNREQAAIRELHGLKPLPQQSRLLEAMEAGLPSCCGTALGFDRLMMWLLSEETIDRVISFPWEIA